MNIIGLNDILHYQRLEAFRETNFELIRYLSMYCMLKIMLLMREYKPECYSNIQVGPLYRVRQTHIHTNVRLNERLCMLCDKHQTEDEFHALMICDVYNEIRHSLL